MEFGVRQRYGNITDDPFYNMSSNPYKSSRSKVRQRIVYAVLAVGFLSVIVITFYLVVNRPPVCRSIGIPCEENGECCSYNCIGGQCGESYWECSHIGVSCQEDNQCCSWSCQKGYCVNPTPTCLTNGKSCTENDQCCSYKCHEGVCSDYGYECITTGSQCKEDGECCTYLCKEGKCAECEQSGASCSRDMECCSYRCHDGKCHDCLDHGSTCEKNEDCCSMLCHEKRCEYHEEYDGHYEEWGEYSHHDHHDGEDHDHDHHSTDDSQVIKPDPTKPKTFIPSEHYTGVVSGYVWRSGPRGVGYYPAHIDEIIAEHKQQHEGQLPHGKLDANKENVINK